MIFDFDGPLCHLFARRTAASVARRLRETYAGPPGGSAGMWPETTDPLRLLTAAFDDSSLPRENARQMERSLTLEEVAAAEVAFPTGYADALVRTLCATGRTVAVATDNSADAVERYLAGRSLLDAFSSGRRPGDAPSRVCGRVCDGTAPLRLKPDPDCVLRALESTGADAAESLMLGDSARDAAAARAAGVGFVGYARNERKERELREAGAEWVVPTLRDVLLTVDPLAHV
ncbi:HAD family hydrolase [Streptomyces sp. 3N207]|uniref:HAD family hydrolase n=1 Tax=Streptomyces sp. 3N207 TaxID=3457417 RepID=UPI003FD5FAF6